MAPYPVLNASSSTPPPLPPSHPKPPYYSTALPQNQWGPDAIGTVFFGVVMFLIGITALWQGRRTRREDDEEGQRGQRTPVGGRPVDEDAVGDAVGEVAEGGGSERVAGDVEVDRCDRSRGEDGMEEEKEGEEEGRGFVKVDRATRTDTEGTLVACDDDGGDDDADEKGKFELGFS